MMNIEVIIVGGGLSGLYAAMLLEKAGINYLLLEGRERMGGRILQANTVEADLGATWFWPTIQPALKQLFRELNIESFSHQERGDMLFERSKDAPSRHPGFVSSPAAARVSGGMSRLPDALLAKLKPERIQEQKMKQTYKAMQVSRPGQLECVEKELPVPGPGEVLIKVEACGICGADSGVVEGLEKSVEYPRVPGHEVVGTICKTSGPLPAWLKPGQRVGVGRLGGHCNACEQCRLGHFNLCQNQPVTGSTRDGGYAEYMLARETGLVAIPDDLSSVDAAPLLCAGVATFNALKKSQAQAGDTVVIQGIGGLGHLALQYARKMGFRVIAVGRGDDIAREVIALGAHYYIDTNKEEAVEVIKAFGGAKVILSTITDSYAVATLLPALLPQGRLMVVGVGKAPLSFTPGLMVGRELQINGAMTGTAIELEKTLNFSLLVAVRAQIETRSLAQAQEAYEKMRSGKASFRMVLTMGHR